MHPQPGLPYAQEAALALLQVLVLAPHPGALLPHRPPKALSSTQGPLAQADAKPSSARLTEAVVLGQHWVTPIPCAANVLTGQ